MSSALERAVDMAGLLEEPRFLEAFCSGCPAKPKLYFEDCAAYNDPEDKNCLRRKFFREIEEIIKGAETDIVITMQEAGCAPA